MPISDPLKADIFSYPLGSEPLTAAQDYDDTPDDGYYNALDFNVAQDLGSGPTYHLGEDWNGEGGGDTDLGDPVYAIANGVVVAVVDDQGSATSGFGNHVVVRHDLAAPIVIDGQTVTHVHSLYAHLQSAAYGADQTTPISVGDAIAIGEQIGAVGKSGFADLAHLHFELTLNDTLPTSDDGYNPSGAPAEWTDPSDFIESANAQLAAPPAEISDAEAIRAALFLSRAVYGQTRIPGDDSDPRFPTDPDDFRQVFDAYESEGDDRNGYDDHYEAYLNQLQSGAWDVLTARIIKGYYPPSCLDESSPTWFNKHVL